MGVIAGLIVLAVGGAGFWVFLFGIDKLDEFEFQNIARGSPTNPVIPESEQRADYLWDTWLIIIAGGVVAAATAVAIIVGTIVGICKVLRDLRHRRRSASRYLDG